jgi:activator of 2-hydroxyglutaryl-CoA dehydratase
LHDESVHATGIIDHSISDIIVTQSHALAQRVLLRVATRATLHRVGLVVHGGAFHCAGVAPVLGSISRMIVALREAIVHCVAGDVVCNGLRYAIVAH